MEKAVTKMTERTEVAMQRATALEGQVRRIEAKLLATNAERARHEAVIKEILISVQN